MNRSLIIAVFLTACMLLAVPAMATTVGAQTVDEDDEIEPSDEYEFEFNATLDNETVTVSVTSNETVLENATVHVNGTEIGVTDSNGTLQFDLENRSTIDVGVTVDETTHTTTYEEVEGELVVQEDTDEGTDFEFDAMLDNQTVTVLVESNDTVVENATVNVNGSEAGVTDANGTLQFTLENRSTIDVSVTHDDVTINTIYDVVEGELVAQETDEPEEDEELPEEMPDEAPAQVSLIQQLITAFSNGEYDQLGPIVSEAVGGGPPADVGNGSENAPDHAGNSSDNRPDQAGNGQGNAPSQAGNGSENAPDQASNGSENRPDQADNRQDSASGQSENEERSSPDSSESPAPDGDTESDRGNSGSDRSSQGNGGSGGNGGQSAR